MSWEDSDRTLFNQRLQDLLNDAERLGLKVCVWLEPQQPLAMGNHVMRFEVRPARYPVVETHAEKLSKAVEAALDFREAASDVLDAKARLRLEGLEAMCGHVENGTDKALTLFQEDRGEWTIKAGNKRYDGQTLADALDAAISWELDL